MYASWKTLADDDDDDDDEVGVNACVATNRKVV